jgi:hypothetical protein
MNPRDPIVNTLGIWASRVLNYFLISLGVSLLLWLMLLLALSGQPIIGPNALDWRVIAINLWETVTGLALTTWSALPPASNPTTAILLRGCALLGCSLTLNLFLLIGRWWRRRSEVVFRRGARILDARPLGD